MKRSTKIKTAIITFFLIITLVIVGRTMVGNHFKKKFSKRPPPGIIVKEVVYKSFSEILEVLVRQSQRELNLLELREII